MPNGIIKDRTGLLEDAKREMEMQEQAMMAQNGMGGEEDIMNIIAEQEPELYAQFQNMSPEQKQEVLASMSGAGTEEGIPMEVGDL
jgi:hypothetical protein